MDVTAYEGVSAQAGNMAAQQRIAAGIGKHGFGDGGMLLGMNMAQAINPMNAAPATQPVPPTPTAAPSPVPAAPASHSPTPAPALSLDEQLDALKKLKELLDAGILSQAEFEAKKKEILGL